MNDEWYYHDSSDESNQEDVLHNNAVLIFEYYDVYYNSFIHLFILIFEKYYNWCTTSARLHNTENGRCSFVAMKIVLIHCKSPLRRWDVTYHSGPKYIA